MLTKVHSTVIFYKKVSKEIQEEGLKTGEAKASSASLLPMDLLIYKE